MAKPSFPPYNVGDLGAGERRQAPAAARNVGPIGDVLCGWLPGQGTILEVASGTGEHALAFARRFPNLVWQPSDPDPVAIKSIAAWCEVGPENLKSPLVIDVRSIDWGVTEISAILCINMVHISPWESSIGLLDGAGRMLPDGGSLILYGPWIRAVMPTAPSNMTFDESLKARDRRWGLRRVEDFEREAALRGLILVDRQPMPSNNLMLRFEAAHA